MQKLLIYSILFFSVQFSFSQNSTVSIDTTNIFDSFYLQEHIDEHEKIVNDLNLKIYELQAEYYQTSAKIEEIDNLLVSYKDLYAKLLKSIYLLKVTTNSTYVFLFSVKSFNQLTLRYSYFKMLVQYLKNLTNYIYALNSQYSTELQSLTSSKQLLNKYLTNYQNEKSFVDSSTIVLQNQCNILQQKTNDLRIRINTQYAEYDTIRNLILHFKIVENDTVLVFQNLSLPLYNTVIISSFGEHNHKYLKNVTVKNDGVDLFSPTDTIVKCVFNGDVVAVIKVPNYGKSVIVQHNDYYSVYSNLNHVYISVGQKIFQGQQIASISKSTSKYSFPCLNLQIWHNTEKLNPEKYYEF